MLLIGPIKNDLRLYYRGILTHILALVCNICIIYAICIILICSFSISRLAVGSFMLTSGVAAGSRLYCNYNISKKYTVYI